MLKIFIVFVISIIIFIIKTEYTEIKCYEIINGQGKKFNIYYSSIMSFFPKYIYVEYEISDQVLGAGLKHIRRFDARLVDDPCINSQIVFPNLINEPGEKKRMVFRIYHGRGDFEIDRIVADVKYGFETQSDTLTGLLGSLQAPVFFSSTTRDFPHYEISDHEYYQLIPYIKPNEAYCIESMGTKNVFSLRIDGSELRHEGAFDHYILNLESHDYYGYAIRKHFLVRTTICRVNTAFQSVKIFTEDGTEKVIAELFDGKKRHLHRAEYMQPYHPEESFQFYRDASDLEIDSLDISVGDISLAVSKEDAILMYATWKERLMCKRIDDISFVDVIRRENRVLQTKSFVGDHFGKSDRIVKIQPGSLTDIQNCIQAIS